MSRSQLATKLQPIEVKQYQHLEAVPLTGSFGARIDNIQIADALDNDDLFTDIHTAWLDYQVLFFRNQELTPTQHLALQLTGLEQALILSQTHPMAITK